MVTKILNGLFRLAKNRGSSRKSARRPASRSGRPLMMESLEGRELMAVAIVDRTFKELDFAGPAAVSGRLSGTFGTNPVNGTFKGNLNLSGQMAYSSPTDAVGQGAAMGNVTGYVYGYGNLPPLALDGETAEGGMKEVAGKFSATLPPQGNVGAVNLAGTINTKNLTAAGTINFTLNGTIKGNGNWSGSFAPINPQPLTVATTAQWDPVKPGVIDVEIEAGGSVQKAATRTTAVATVSVYWGTAVNGRLTKLPDTIPVLWNQASGDYEISKLPVPPAAAAKLLIVTTYGTTINTIALELPPKPTISINSVSVTPPLTGYGDMVFTVKISGDTAFPVSVNYATMNGTAISKQDYVVKSGVLTFQPGGPLEQTITVKVRKDATVANQDFYVQLKTPKWGTIAGTGKGTGSIIDIP